MQTHLSLPTVLYPLSCPFSKTRADNSVGINNECKMRFTSSTVASLSLILKTTFLTSLLVLPSEGVIMLLKVTILLRFALIGVSLFQWKRRLSKNCAHRLNSFSVNGWIAYLVRGWVVDRSVPDDLSSRVTLGTPWQSCNDLHKCKSLFEWMGWA